MFVIAAGWLPKYVFFCAGIGVVQAAGVEWAEPMTALKAHRILETTGRRAGFIVHGAAPWKGS